MPATATLSLTAIGTPTSGPSSPDVSRDLGLARRVAREIGGHRDERAQRRVVSGNPVQNGVNDIHRRHVAASIGSSQIGCRQEAPIGQVRPRSSAGRRIRHPGLVLVQVEPVELLHLAPVSRKRFHEALGPIVVKLDTRRRGHRPHPLDLARSVFVSHASV